VEFTHHAEKFESALNLWFTLGKRPSIWRQFVFKKLLAHKMLLDIREPAALFE